MGQYQNNSGGKVGKYQNLNQGEIGRHCIFRQDKGIEYNSHLAVNAASDLTDSIANAVSGKCVGVNMSMPDISRFSLPLIAQGAALSSNWEFIVVMQADGGGDALERIEKMIGNMLARMGRGNETKL